MCCIYIALSYLANLTPIVLLALVMLPLLVIPVSISLDR